MTSQPELGGFLRKGWKAGQLSGWSHAIIQDFGLKEDPFADDFVEKNPEGFYIRENIFPEIAENIGKELALFLAGVANSQGRERLLIWTGPAGVGKKTLGISLAKEIQKESFSGIGKVSVSNLALESLTSWEGWQKEWDAWLGSTTALLENTDLCVVFISGFRQSYHPCHHYHFNS